MITPHVIHLTFVMLCLVVWSSASAQGPAENERLESTVAAPPNTNSVGSALGGAFFVDETLLDRYEALKARLVQIREDIALGNASGQDTLSSLAQIEEESKRLRADLETAKVLVSAFQVYSKKSEQVFDLGRERLVIITGDDVVVRGWEGPGIKCVAEKIILAKEQPDDSDFDAIQVHHELTIATDKVGLTLQQRDDQEREFLQSEAGRKLTDQQRAERQNIVATIHHGYDDYEAFQGREANVLQLQGLAHQESNRNLTMRISSPGRGQTVSSQWQRHATMTVYVPPCKALAVRGSLVGLDVQDVVCDLVLTSHGSRDRKYDGSFAVSGVTGNITISHVPVRTLSQVTGNVRFIATNEFVNSGTRHVGGTRTVSPYGTQATQIDQISGDLQAAFVRTDLRLSSVTGTLDIVNEYGPTHLTLRGLDAERAHRIISQTGRIQVEGPVQLLTATPIYAYTQCGRLHTDLPREVLENTAFSTLLRGWHGLVTPSEDRFDFRRLERPEAALANGDRAAGLDLVSHAGMVSILTSSAEDRQ